MAQSPLPSPIVNEQAPDQTESAPRFTIGDVVLVALAGFATALVVSLIMVAVDGVGADDLTTSIIILLPAQYIGQFVVLAWIVKRRGTTLTEGLRFDIRPSDLFYILTGLALQFVIALVFLPIYELAGLDESGQTIVDVAADSELPLLGLVVLSVSAALLAPIVEELTYRGVLLRSLERRMSVRATIIVSSLVFASVHILSVDLSDPKWLIQFGILIPQLFLVAVPLAWLTFKHDRLGPAIFTHAGFNLWLVIFVAGADYFTSLQ
jgi:membrane protease YdiL (CAAX protease family)